MKFVCDNCKAKYQIGDDKVSGKTVRMKCRKCGHLILVSAAVTESSVSRAAPAEGTPLGGSSGSTPLPAATPTPPPGAMTAVADDDDDGATKIMKVPPMVPARPAAPPAAPSAPARPSTGGLRVPAAPRSGSAPPPTPSGAGLASAPSAPARPVTGGTPRPPPARPGVPRAGIGAGSSGIGGPGGLVPQATPSAPSLGDLAQRSMAGAISTAARGSAPAPGAPPRSLSPSRGVLAVGGAGGPAGPASTASGVDASAGGGVAGAFQRAVAGTQPVLKADTPGEDWYVGVGGVPLGPVRLSVIREKVDQGAVDGESLVWREGFDEWQPLRNVPGLRAILDERKAAPLAEPPRVSSTSLPRVSAPTPIPGALHVSAVPSPPTPPPPGVNGHGLAVGHVPTGGVSLGPAAGPTPGPAAEPSPAAPAPFAGGLAAGGLAAGGLAAGGLAAAGSTAGSTAAGSGDAGMVQAAAPAPAPPPVVSAPSVPPPARDERKGMHPFAYAMIAMAAVFGGVAAWVLLKPAPQQVIVVQSAAAPTVPGLAAAPPPPPTAEPTAEPTAGADPKAGGPKVASGGPGARATAEPGATTKPGDPPPNLGGSFDQGVGGPNAGPGKDGASSGRGQLSEGEISGVVQRNMAGVRRRCWQPALDARSASAPKSARVSTTVTISPSGSVSSVSASGSETHFPGLASCIGGAIRGWQFPPSDGPTTVNIPFSFNAQ